MVHFIPRFVKTNRELFVQDWKKNLASRKIDPGSIQIMVTLRPTYSNKINQSVLRLLILLFKKYFLSIFIMRFFILKKSGDNSAKLWVAPGDSYAKFLCGTNITRLNSLSFTQQFFQDGARIESAFRKYFYRAAPEQTEDSYEIIVCHANVIRYFVCR